MDHAAWIETALQRFERPLLLQARRLLRGDLEAARDVVQEAFLRLCAQEGADLEPRLGAWLHAVCRNLAIDRLRKERPMHALADADLLPAAAVPAPAEVLAAADERQRLAAQLAVLRERPRAVVQLKFVEGLSYREIGARLGISEGNVGFILHQTLRRLRERLAAPVHPQGVLP